MLIPGVYLNISTRQAHHASSYNSWEGIHLSDFLWLRIAVDMLRENERNLFICLKSMLRFYHNIFIILHRVIDCFM